MPDPNWHDQAVAANATIQKIVNDYVGDYEMCGDDSYYQPTEDERGLIMDAIQGLICDDDFCAAMAKHFKAMNHLKDTPNAR